MFLKFDVVTTLNICVLIRRVMKSEVSVELLALSLGRRMIVGSASRFCVSVSRTKPMSGHYVKSGPFPSRFFPDNLSLIIPLFEVM